MSHDPLHAPLRPRRWRDRLRLPASPALVAFAIVLVSLAGLFAWAWMQPAPAPRDMVVERPLPPRPAEQPRQQALQPATTSPRKAAQPATSSTGNRASRILSVSELPDDPETGSKDKERHGTKNAAVVVDISGAARPLPPVPARDLVENSRFGPLPRAGRGNRLPWRVYARPVPPAELAATRPKLAVLVVDLGLKANLTRTAIRRLPPQVSLAFAPRGRKVRALGLQARRHGHEFFLQLPMEPWGYPAVDPGPDTLLTSLDAAANRQRLHRLLARAVGYAGVVTYAGQKLLRTGEALSPILHELKKRGLLAIDDGTTAQSMLPALALVVGLPALRADVRLPPGLKEEEIRAFLQRARQQARERGQALLVVSGDEATLPILRTWLSDLTAEGDISLVPVTALAKLATETTARTP